MGYCAGSGQVAIKLEPGDCQPMAVSERERQVLANLRSPQGKILGSNSVSPREGLLCTWANAAIGTGQLSWPSRRQQFKEHRDAKQGISFHGEGRVLLTFSKNGASPVLLGWGPMGTLNGASQPDKVLAGGGKQQ